jgi:hypothetical protein
MSTLCLNKSLRIIDFLRVGLVFRHIYTVLDIQEFNYLDDTIRLLRLRNPWGKKGWSGPLVIDQVEKSPEWSEWPQKIKAKVAKTFTNDDGCFWISYNDFLK